MIDLKDFAKQIARESNIDTKKANQLIITYLEDNKWFHLQPVFQDGKVYLTNQQVAVYSPPLATFMALQNEPEKEKILFQMFQTKFPDTASKLLLFFRTLNIQPEAQFYVEDFLLEHLKQDLCLMNDKQVQILVQAATDELTKTHGDLLTFFLSWLKKEYRTAYYNDYVMDKRYTLEENGAAYDFDEYLELMYYLYNADYIAENEMLQQAARSKNYADTWLYLSLYFISSLRYTDLRRIPHPTLSKEPEEVLDAIFSETFTEADARGTLASVTWRLCVLPLTPNKTSNTTGVSSIKFTVPESCEVLLGTLFALCEAHRYVQEIPDDAPLIRKIQTYDEIIRYMGEDIGSLFLEANFHSRSANKSYLQAAFILTDDILGSDDNAPYVRGYMMSSLARSHKGSFGEFAATTMVYLKDAKLSGLTPEFVAKELFERGVLSFIPSMLLKMITQGEYNRLSVEKQTALHKTLHMSPMEVEKTVAITTRAKKMALSAATTILNQNSQKSVLSALHTIGSGAAFSKQPEYMCLLTAFQKVCPYDDRRTCVGCSYEISTKSTIIHMVEEYNRLYSLFFKATDPYEKKKYQKIMTDVVLPALDETMECLKELYGTETYHAVECLIKENLI